MAEDTRHFVVTIPAGTAKAAPVTTPLVMPVQIVRRIEWRVPNGPMGTMGWLLAMSGVPVLPVSQQSVYIVANSETGAWDTAGYPDSGAWQVTGYNTGSNPHSVYLTFHLDNIRREAGLLPLLSAYELGPSPDLSRAGPPVPGHR